MPQEKKQALVLGGGAWQVPLIHFLQEKGLDVTVVDPLEQCPGAKIAKRHLPIDARDSQAILKATQSGGFTFVTSDQSDMAIETVAKVSQGLGTRGNDIAAVQRFTDKTKCRELAAKLAIPQPQFRAAQSAEEVRNFIAARSTACIVKPADSQSSRGVTRVESGNDPKDAVALALSYSLLKKVIVEDFVVGREITVEGLCSGGKHRCFAASIKEHFRTAIANKLLYPAPLSANLERQIFAAMDKFVENSGLEFGITHAEFLVDLEREKFWLVEIACRGGGTLISSDIAPWVSGVDFYSIHYANLKGEITALQNLERKARGALLGFFEFPEGTVGKIEGLELARSWPGVFRLNLDFHEGDNLRKAADDRSRQGFAILFSDSASEVENLWNRVRAQVQVRIGR